MTSSHSKHPKSWACIMLLVILVVCQLCKVTNAFQQPYIARSQRQQPVTVVPRSGMKDRLYNNNKSFDMKRGCSWMSSSSSNVELDTDAVAKYATAAAVQLSLFSAIFYALDQIVSISPLEQLPAPAVGFLFYFFSLKSRTLNPLNNKRPELSEDGVPKSSSDGFRDRVMPSWTPPGVVFPIMWILLIGPARAYSSMLVFQNNGHQLLDPALLSLALHLTIGDIWNTINNTEKRYGTAVIGVLCVVASAANAAIQYYNTYPLAGQILGATLLWLCTAAALITDTWRLNPKPDGNRDPLYPVKGEASTSFLWFADNK